MFNSRSSRVKAVFTSLFPAAVLLGFSGFASAKVARIYDVSGWVPGNQAASHRPLVDGQVFSLNGDPLQVCPASETLSHEERVLMGHWRRCNKEAAKRTKPDYSGFGTQTESPVWLKSECIYKRFKEVINRGSGDWVSGSTGELGRYGSGRLIPTAFKNYYVSCEQVVTYVRSTVDWKEKTVYGTPPPVEKTTVLCWRESDGRTLCEDGSSGEGTGEFPQPLPSGADY